MGGIIVGGGSGDASFAPFTVLARVALGALSIVLVAKLLSWSLVVSASLLSEVSGTRGLERQVNCGMVSFLWLCALLFWRALVKALFCPRLGFT